jgi:TonB family protein
MAHHDQMTMGLLPERRWDWRTFAVSYGAEALLILFILSLGLLFPEKAQLVTYHLTSLVALKPYEPPKPPRVKQQIMAHLPPPPSAVVMPRLVVPHEMRRTPQQEMEAPKLNEFEARNVPAVLKQQSGALPAVVHTGEFGGSSVPVTLNKPVDKVQTGGFGDPNGLRAADSKNSARLVTAQLGSFDMPVGPGQGNGSAGARGAKGTVASAGFGQGIAQPGAGDGRSSGRGAIQTGSFGNMQASGPAGPRAQSVQGPASTGVEIISKPNPAYTEEARNLKVEGEVLLEVLFTADGHLQVQRVVRGLGHGLDEAAAVAASKIRFKPATRNGQPVDSTAVVHVVFQLAY